MDIDEGNKEIEKESKSSSKHRSSRSSSHRSRRKDKDRHRDRDKDRHRRDKDKDKDKDRHRDRDRRDRKRKRRHEDDEEDDRSSRRGRERKRKRREKSNWDKVEPLDGGLPNEQMPPFGVPPMGRGRGRGRGRGMSPMGGRGMSPMGGRGINPFNAPPPNMQPPFGRGGGIGGLPLPMGRGINPFLPPMMPPMFVPNENLLVEKQRRRLYVGNIPPNVNEQEVQSFFDNEFIKKGVIEPGTSTVQMVNINHDKCFAFIEVKDPDHATSGMDFDGIVFLNNILKIKRPKDYVSPTNAEPHSPHKVFIGGLPKSMTKEQVKKLISSYGELKNFNLVRDAVGNSKGYGFFEFVDVNVTDHAIKELDLKKILDRTINCRRAAAGKLGGVALVGDDPIDNILNLNLPVLTTLHEMQLLGKIPQPTRILMILNIASPAWLSEEGNHEFLCDEVRNECQQFGEILSIYIPEPEKDKEVPCVGRAFVEFNLVDDCNKAYLGIAGRKYNKRCLLTSFYDEEKYKNKQFGRIEVSSEEIDKILPTISNKNENNNFNNNKNENNNSYDNNNNNNNNNQNHQINPANKFGAVPHPPSVQAQFIVNDS